MLWQNPPLHCSSNGGDSFPELICLSIVKNGMYEAVLRMQFLLLFKKGFYKSRYSTLCSFHALKNETNLNGNYRLSWQTLLWKLTFVTYELKQMQPGGRTDGQDTWSEQISLCYIYICIPWHVASISLYSLSSDPPKREKENKACSCTLYYWLMHRSQQLRVERELSLALLQGWLLLKTQLQQQVDTLVILFSVADKCQVS